MAKDYVLVSQGVEIFRTKDKEEAERIKDKSDEEWWNYVQKCIENGGFPVDNEVFMYEEDVE